MTSWVWDDAKAFQRWICLLMFTAWEDTEMIFHNKRVKVKRGQMVTSKRQLAQRWHTNSRIVTNLLQNFVCKGMIMMDVKDNMTIITVLNYDKYQYNSENNEKYFKFSREDVFGEVENDHNNATSVQSGSHKRSQNKINNNKLENDFTPEARAHEIEYFEILTNSEKLFTDETMQILEITQDEIPQLLEMFKDEQLRREKMHDNVGDYKRHFLNWLDKKVKDGKRRSKNKRNNAGGKSSTKTQSENSGGTENIPRTAEKTTDSSRDGKINAKETGKSNAGGPLKWVTVRKAETDG